MLSGEDAFKLHDTLGVYIDITEQMAHEAGLKVDRPGYASLMEEAQRKAAGCSEEAPCDRSVGRPSEN